jgi:hypothetical protein
MSSNKQTHAQMIYRVLTNTPVKERKKQEQREQQEQSKRRIRSASSPISAMSPMSATAASKSKTMLEILNEDTMRRIALKDLLSSLKYKLRYWIPIDKLTINISDNHNAIDFLSSPSPENKTVIDKLINYPKLSKNTNPDAIHLLRLRYQIEKSGGVSAKDRNRIAWLDVANNPHLFELYKDKIEDETVITDAEWKRLSGNPKAIKMVLALAALAALAKTTGRKIDMYGLSGNTSTRAIKYLISQEDKEDISWSLLSANTNPNAIKFLSLQEDNIDWEQLSGNSNVNAVKLLRKKWDKEKELMKADMKEYNALKKEGDLIHWNIVSKNTNKYAIRLLRKKIAEDKKLASASQAPKKSKGKVSEIENVDWANLSGNPSPEALLLLKENIEKINWKVLCGNINPDVIDLLRERLKDKPSDINWEVLSGSRNPRAIELLEENKEKIHWGEFSSNTSLRAINLLRDRVEYEKSAGIETSNKISWFNLSANPSIFTIQ